MVASSGPVFSSSMLAVIFSYLRFSRSTSLVRFSISSLRRRISISYCSMVCSLSLTSSSSSLSVSASLELCASVLRQSTSSLAISFCSATRLISSSFTALRSFLVSAAVFCAAFSVVVCSLSLMSIWFSMSLTSLAHLWMAASRLLFSLPSTLSSISVRRIPSSVCSSDFCSLAKVSCSRSCFSRSVEMFFMRNSLSPSTFFRMLVSCSFFSCSFTMSRR
mmetsp:Transcript_44301/g.113116  ORF Transcript_44301/g.113116 Transcript_44301/m.113116 type:complete len:220 (+) Transcript_44301:1156-1815(+)